MRREIDEIPEAVARLLENGAEAVSRAADAARALDPHVLLSVARGSSDHVCTYLKYAAELLLHLPMASLGPSVRSVYGVDVRADRALGLSVSQSGRSPDIVQMTESIRAGGALTVAITNDPASPLSSAAEQTLPIHAGPELSVAATKTFVSSLVVGLWLTSELAGDKELTAAIRCLPGHLEKAIHCDWSEVIPSLHGQSLFTLGRGSILGDLERGRTQVQGNVPGPCRELLVSRGAPWSGCHC